MSKNWIKLAVAVFVFLISLFVTDMVLNRATSDITTEMAEATLPVISVKIGEYKINTMYGYTSKRDERFVKDSLTPISSNREITIVVDTYKKNIKNIEYEVRSIDGERLIEGSEVKLLQKMPGSIQFSIQLKDLTEINKEYSFVTILTLEEGEKVYYYTRFIQNESYYEKEKLDFIMDFHNVTFHGEGAEIKQYLESNSKGDNTNFHSVNIHSSLKQVMWDQLPVEKIEEPVILVKDITAQTASVILQYMVKEKEASGRDYYFVEEYYRVRYTPSRMYLLDYERNMDEIFDADKKSFFNDKIYLGITDANVSMMESEGGKNLAFVNADRLFLYSTVDNRLAEVFSFYNKNNFDIRTRNRNFDIKILKIEDSGNLAFMVAGYMNRGIHEGEVGIVVYYYDTVQNTIEEQIFIPYEKSADILINELQNLSYLNVENHLFIVLEGNLYDISLEQKQYEIILTELTKDTYKVSQSGRIIAWLKENKPYESKTLFWMNLNDSKKKEITSGYHEYITALGFMEEDLIYGLVKKQDIQKEPSGNILFPIYKLLIRNQDNKILKGYEKEDCYVVNCSIAENQITLNRIRVYEDKGVKVVKNIEDDHIASKDIKDGNVNRVSIVAIDTYKKIVQLVLKNTTEPNSLKIMTPKEVIFEGGRQVSIKLTNAGQNLYVYGPKGVEDITISFAEAVKRAYELSGSVVDTEGNYIWKKGRTYTKNQIMAITERRKDKENGPLAVCLDTILEYEGISKRTQALIDTGKDALGILQESLREAKILELRGCPLDSVLNYVDQDIPVLVFVNQQEAYLIIGFNEQNVVLMDPNKGTIYKKGMNDSRELFEKNGNQFITYMK